jgi:hypothetical protein
VDFEELHAMGDDGVGDVGGAEVSLSPEVTDRREFADIQGSEVFGEVYVGVGVTQVEDAEGKAAVSERTTPNLDVTIFYGEELDGIMMDSDTLENADVDTNNIPLFLYQSGYLTIKNYSDGIYTLGFPNKEVKTALFRIALPNALAKQDGIVQNAISRMKIALIRDDVQEAMENLQQLVSETPYAKKGDKKLEDRFRFILKNALFLCGCRVDEEKQMATGQIDLVAHFRNIIMVMELKLDSNKGIEGAKEQMTERKYTSAYSAEQKNVYAIAVSFSTKDKGITHISVEKCE